MQSHYRVLGVNNFASIEEVKRVYKTLAKKYHPDVNPGNAFAEERFKDISNAYNTLSDPLKKRIYDDKLRAYLFPRVEPKASKYAPPKAHPHYQARYHRKPYAAPKVSKKKERKIYILSTIIGIGFIAFLLTFYHYMNLHSAKKYHAIALDYKNKGETTNALLNLELARRYNKFDSQINELEGDLVILERKAYKEALFYYTEAIAEAKEVRYPTFFKRGKAFMNLQRYTEAIGDFRTVAEQAVLKDSAYLYLGELYLRSEGNYLKAIHCFNEFEKLSQQPGKSIVLHNLRGYSHLKLGNFKKAISDFESQLKLEPENAFTDYLLAQTHVLNEDQEKACFHYKEAIKKGFEKAFSDCEKFNCGCED